MKCNILHAALCFSLFLALSFPLYSQQLGLPVPQPTPSKTEKQKAQEELDKAQAELDKAKANLEKIQKAEPNRENNRKLGESVEKELNEAQAKKDESRVRVLSQLLEEIRKRLEKDLSQDPGKLLDEALSATEQKFGGRLPKDLKDKIKQDIYNRSGLDLRAKGTGRTTGHIANLEITNLGDEPITFSMPVMEIASTGEYQGYIVDVTPPVTMAPGDSEIIPLFGYCTDIFTPPVPINMALPPFEDWKVNTTIIEHVYDIVEIIKTFQSHQDHATPLSDHPDIETITITQHVLWLTDSPNGIYTFEDICINITKQIETITGRPVSTFAPGEYNTFRNGLDDIIEMINEVGVTAGIPSFVPSIIIPEEFRPKAFPPPPDNGIEYTITATGTGRTTGHIADLTFTNPGKTPTTIQIGSGTGLFIPSSGQYQPYIVPSLPPVPIGPGETITIPVEGYCVDIHLPPVPSGSGMPAISDWYSVPTSTGTETTPGVITIPTNFTFPMDLAHDILINSQPLVWSSLGEDCIPAVHQTTSTIPGTRKPIPGGEDGLFSTTQKPDVIVPILLDAITRISIAYDEMKKENLITTPFSGNPEKEREAVIQQTFWRFTSSIEGKKYEKQNFQDNTIRQFEQNTGKDFESMPEPQKDKISEGADDFWDTFEAVGVEAKVLEVPPVVPTDPTTPPQDIWKDYNVGETKATTANDNPPPSIPLPDENVMINADAAGPHCKCGKISFTLDLKGENGTHQISSDQHKKEIEVEDINSVIGEVDSTGRIRDTGSFYINDLEVSCECSSTGRCNSFPRHSQFAEADEGKATVTSSNYDVYSNSSGTRIWLINKKPGNNSDIKFKIYAWCKGDSCAETRDCFENFTISLKQKQN